MCQQIENNHRIKLYLFKNTSLKTKISLKLLN